MRCAVYARFSSDLQRKTSITDQIAVARAHAAGHGWTIEDRHIYTDAALSGASTDGRPGLQALLDAAHDTPQGFNVLLVDDSSRISRDLADALRVMQRLRFAGVRVIYISQGIDSASEQAETLTRTKRGTSGASFSGTTKAWASTQFAILYGDRFTAPTA